MYYKIKVNKNNLEFVGKVRKAKLNDGFLYLTKEEIARLNPRAVKNIDITKEIGGESEKKN